MDCAAAQWDDRCINDGSFSTAGSAEAVHTENGLLVSAVRESAQYLLQHLVQPGYRQLYSVFWAELAVFDRNFLHLDEQRADLPVDL